MNISCFIDLRSNSHAVYCSFATIIFPVSNHDERLYRKKRVLGVMFGEEAKAFSIEECGTSISLVHDSFNGEDLVIAGSKDRNFMVAFKRQGADGVSHYFTAAQNSLPVIMKDNEGALYNLFGRAVDGPGIGTNLPSVTQFGGYWFAWAAFYPEIELY